jgi:hypothetical protein
MKPLLKKTLLYGGLGVAIVMFSVFLGTFQYQKGYQKGFEQGRMHQKQLDWAEFDRTGKLE